MQSEGYFYLYWNYTRYICVVFFFHAKNNIFNNCAFEFSQQNIKICTLEFQTKVLNIS